jgi:DSBA-like thioredoxin domain
VATVKFWFDPACYWSWRAARWLMDAADQRDLEIEWQSFSLTVLYGDEMNPDWRSMLNTSHRALRVVEALKENKRADDLTRFYITLGTAVHEQGEQMSEATVRAAADASGVTDVIDAMDDPAWDEKITSSFETAMASAGPDVGSPIMEVPGATRGIYGPVFAEVPPKEDAGDLWDSVVRLATTTSFYELKRGRR